MARSPFEAPACLTCVISDGDSGADNFKLEFLVPVTGDSLLVSQITGDGLTPCTTVADDPPLVVRVYFAGPVFNSIEINNPGTVITAVSDGTPACATTLFIPS